MTAIGGRRSDENKSLHDALVQLRERLSSPPPLSAGSHELPDIETTENLDPSRLAPQQRRFEAQQTSLFSWRLIAGGGALVLAAALGSTLFFVDFDGIDPANRTTTGAAPAQLLQNAAKADRQGISETLKVATRKIRNPDIADFGSPASAHAPDAPLPSTLSQQDDKPLPWPDPPQRVSWPTVANSSPAAAPAAQTPPPVERQLDAKQAAALLQRAEALVANGDLTAARLILQRLAEGKNARAAYLLAKTYDPAVMQELGIIGIKPEPDKARSWYDQARNWGFPGTERRLQARSAAPSTVGQH